LITLDKYKGGFFGLSLLINFTILFLLIGLYLLVKKSTKKMLWSGILCILVAIGLWYTAGTWKTDREVIGIQVVKNTPQEYQVEMRYFDLKADALAYYQKQAIKDFSLAARFEGDTKEFFYIIGNNKNKVKRIKFANNPEKKHTGFQEYQDFFIRYKLVPVDKK
jgi:hypothetical protein